MYVPSYLVSAPIPIDKSGKPILTKFAKGVRRLIEEDCDGIYIFGTSGEGYAFSDEEFKDIVTAFAAATANFSGFVQVGCLALNSTQVLQRCQFCWDQGIREAQITLPPWKPLSNQELDLFFDEICGSFPEMKFLLYNNPRNKRKLNGRELERAHKRNKNLVAAKTGSGTLMDFHELIMNGKSLQHFVAEPAFLYCSGLTKVGLIPSSNYFNAQRCREYFQATLDKNYREASALQSEIIQFFMETALPLLEKNYIDGAIDKAYAKLGGWDLPLTMKKPYATLNPKDFKWLKEHCFSKSTV